MYSMNNFISELKIFMLSSEITDDRLILNEKNFKSLGILYTVRFIKNKLNELITNKKYSDVYNTLEAISCYNYPNCSIYADTPCTLIFKYDADNSEDLCTYDNSTQMYNIIVSDVIITNHVISWWDEIYSLDENIASLRQLCYRTKVFL